MERTKRKAVSKETTDTGKETCKQPLGAESVLQADVPRSILARLLDLAGKPQGISPRLLMGKPTNYLSPHQLTELYGTGFIELPRGSEVTLSTNFVKIAKVLLDPQTNLTFRIWGKDNISGETNIQFPGHIIDGNGVILNQIGTYYRINAFVNDKDIFKLIGPVLPVDSEQKINFDFEGHFDFPVVAVLFGIIDLARRRMKGGTAQTGKDIMASSIQEINDYLLNQWGLTGFEDLITYITVTGMNYQPPSLSQIIESLIILTDTEVLTKEKGEYYTLSPVFIPLVTRTVGEQAGLQWQRVTRLMSGELLWSHRIYIFTDSSLILQFAPTVEGKIFVSKVTPIQITDFLIQELTLPPLIVSVKPDVPASEVRRTTSVSTGEQTIASPLPTTVKSIEQVDLKCRFCGRDNAQGMIMCKFCGHPLAKVKTKMSVPSERQPSLPASSSAISAEKLANTQQQLLALQQEMKSHKLELSKLEVRYKVGEVSLDQYQNSVSTLQSKIKKLENDLESLAGQI